MQVKTLKTYNSINDGLKAITALEEGFYKQFKRKSDLELTFTVMSSPFDRSKKRIPSAYNETVEVRCWFDDKNTQHIEQLNWFVSNA